MAAYNKNMDSPCLGFQQLSAIPYTLTSVHSSRALQPTDGVQEGRILGIKYGFRGFYDTVHKPVVLTKQYVDGIQLQGGTILGTSRGGANMK